MFNPAMPHNDLPSLPPRVELETKEILKKCIGARTALAELRLAGQLIPDQTVLSSIALLEAKVSSEIENIVTTNDTLFQEASFAGVTADPAAKEAVRNRSALYAGLDALKTRPISARLAVEICRHVKGIDLDLRATPGVALRNAATREIVYTPPEGQVLIQDLLTNWEKFINLPSDLDPVIRMAVQHYQFEAIHPFPDGNGRTGRILNVLCLIQDKLLDLPVLFLSRHILATRSDYYRLLGDVTKHGAWLPWLSYMLEAVEQTAIWTSHKIRAIRLLMDNTSEHVRQTTKIYSREMIELIFAQPYCRIENMVEHGIAKRQTASKYLQIMRDNGVLWELPRLGNPDKVFVNVRYRELLGSEHNTVEPF